MSVVSFARMAGRSLAYMPWAWIVIA